MSTYVDMVTKTTAALATKNGRYDERTPKMSPSAMVAFLGLVSSGIPSAIKRACSGVYAYGSVSDDGRVIVPFAAQIPADTYAFKSIPSSSAAWRRRPTTDNPFFTEYEPAREGSLVRNDQLEQVAFIRQMIDDFQAAMDAIALALQAYPYGGTCGADQCKSFMQKLRPLASDLDTLGENPPTTWSADVKGALNVALEESTHAAGELAAGVGNVAGNAAGSLLGGFLSSANATTLIVAAVVGFVALKRTGVV